MNRWKSTGAWFLISQRYFSSIRTRNNEWGVTPCRHTKAANTGNNRASAEGKSRTVHHQNFRKHLLCCPSCMYMDMLINAGICIANKWSVLVTYDKFKAGIGKYSTEFFIQSNISQSNRCQDKRWIYIYLWMIYPALDGRWANCRIVLAHTPSLSISGRWGGFCWCFEALDIELCLNKHKLLYRMRNDATNA